MKTLTYLILLLCIVTQSHAQSEAEKLVDESIRFHDPRGNWQKLNAEISITSILERKGERDTSSREIYFDLSKGIFEMKQDSVTYTYPCEDCERATMYNSYFRYLLGMPMKLKDPGTILKDQIDLKTYKQKEYRVVTATYDPEVGTYTWLFYFGVDSPELVLVEFSKDGTFQNGETIELNNKVKFQKMLLPGQLKWFVLPDRPFLAEENIKYERRGNK